jgi:hypothetical protein
MDWTGTDCDANHEASVLTSSSTMPGAQVHPHHWTPSPVVSSMCLTFLRADGSNIQLVVFWCDFNLRFKDHEDEDVILAPLYYQPKTLQVYA